MTSLAETYGARGSRTRKRLLAGTGLFLAGALLIVAGIVVASTGVLSAVGVGTVGAREIAGIVAGLGVPAVFVGVFTVLPASRKERAAAAVGALVAIAGVGLFRYAYPERWIGAAGAGSDLTFAVLVVYFLGTLTTFWVLFTSVVNVRSRAPGGTVTLQRIIRRATGSTGEGIQRPGSKPDGTGGGSVGIAGGFADGTGGTDDLTAARNGGDAGVATSDGGSESEILRTPESGGRVDDGTAGTRQSPTAADPDRYCGSCAHFDYVRTDRGIQPYCGFHDELMDDMEACEQWEANTAPGSRS